MGDKLINQYLNDLMQRGYSVNTIKAYRHSLTLLNSLNINQATTADLMKILSQNNWDRSTVIARQVAIKAFFKWLSNNGIIQYNPADGLGSIRPRKSLSKAIAEEDYCRIIYAIKKLPVSPQAFFLTIINCKLKINEALSLNRDNIDWEKEAFVVSGKNGLKTIPFSQHLEYKALLKQISTRKFLFVTYKNEKPSYDWVYYWWRKIMKSTKLNYTISQLSRQA